MYVGDVPIQMLIGCEKNIIDDRTWRAMKAQGVKIDQKVEKHGIKFYGYGNAGLENLVTFEAKINTSEGRELMETFYVINDGMQPLLGKRTSEKLGILKIDLPPHDGIVPLNNLEYTKIDPFPKNVLLNAAKCRIKMRQVKFLGHVRNGEGIRPSEDKIIAIKKFRTPETKEEIRSFLGIVTFVARFIPDLATKTNSLRQLIKKDVKFE